ncbi:hypothetical protein M413DRAFT_21692 [Hebeloma cylindrosporum]|uniref:Uncharacterized protein n=1 Tax=Hebeloma cylindrosporum TaxID=76867 RepID=A0A0C3D021_HEBCY|nr:hypothetical protein M413DRAFT_21692 [Hebeloma cylindrosporum h7]
MIAPQPLVLAPVLPAFRAHDYSLERLRSPIHLSAPCLPTPPPVVSCIPSSSRRRSKKPSRSRRRLPPRVESHAFDDLPWISSLDVSPDLLNPWDIADLSLIPDSDLRSSPGPGPVRRRKSSLRSSPINSTKPSSSPGSALPIRDTSLLSPSSVSTPPPRFIPSRVLFHNLMPVSCDGRSEPPHPCITSSRANF